MTGESRTEDDKTGQWNERIAIVEPITDENGREDDGDDSGKQRKEQSAAE